MQPIQLQWIDYTILIAYVAFVLDICANLGALMLLRAIRGKKDLRSAGCPHIDSNNL